MAKSAKASKAPVKKSAQAPKVKVKDLEPGKSGAIKGGVIRRRLL